MAYNTKAILKDAHGKPIPQYYNSVTDAYEPVEGSDGAMDLVVADSNGVVLTQAQILQTLLDGTQLILSKLDELIGVVE